MGKNLISALLTTWVGTMPLLETEQHKIILAPIAPREVDNGVLVYTERQNKDGSGSRLVPYEVDCAGARVRKQGRQRNGLKPNHSPWQTACWRGFAAKGGEIIAAAAPQWGTKGH